MSIQHVIRISILLSTLLTAFSTQAGQISFSSNWTLGDVVSWTQSVSSASDDLNSFRSLYLNKFDSSLGTLNKVTLELTGDVDSTAGAVFRDVDYSGNTDTSGYQSLTYSSYLSGSGFSQAGPGYVRSDTCYSSSSSVAAQCSIDFALQTQNIGLNSISFTSLSKLNTFTGLGSFSTTVGLLGQMFSVEDDDDSGFVLHREGRIAGTGTLKVIYDYSALPPAEVSEPFSFSLLSLALVGLGIANQRRRTA